MGDTTPDVNDALIESWTLSLHNLRPRTIDLYLAEVRRFAAWLVDHDRPRLAPGDLLAVARHDIEAWLTDLRAQGRAGDTIRSRWIALRNLYRWAAEEDEVAVNPIEKVVVVRPEPPPIAVLRDEEIAALLSACKGAGWMERRDLALIRLLLSTGLRVSEVCGIQLADLDLSHRVVMIRGKGGKDRLVRYDPETTAALDRYRRARGRHRLAALPDLWVGYHGPLTRKGVPHILDKRAAAAGIGHIHPHQLRHTWAHRWLAAGGNEGDLQRLGGWGSDAVMRRYGASMAAERALAAYDTVNPLGGL